MRDLVQAQIAKKDFIIDQLANYLSDESQDTAKSKIRDAINFLELAVGK